MFAGKIQDSRIRWTAGERLDHLWEDQCDRIEALGTNRYPAVIDDSASHGYRDLDDLANRMARHFASRGIRQADRVALLLDRSIEAYASILAVLKLNAAYVPLDPVFPDDRIDFILQDAGASAVVTFARHADRLSRISQRLIVLDRERTAIAQCSPARIAAGDREAPTDELAYIIYTSGTTGRPKGVAIEHSSICNFVRVAAETYGMRPGDRVYQGLTLAFDFSVEEIWVSLFSGATLVPAPACSNLVGEDLGTFLQDQRISVLCCVPTLLATIEQDLPDLRILLVSGEACPQELVRRWHSPSRTILNAYGPTEATVTATLTELHPGRPVTIGRPLPSYTIVILAEDRPELVPAGDVGEIGIAGIGLARGYLNRDDLTAAKFVPDFASLPSNPSHRIYRTGDLGRYNDAGEIEYLGRKDTQVKIRGYRIELGEIEAVLLAVPQVSQATVGTFATEAGEVELVAYYVIRSGLEEVSAAEIRAQLRERLPAYMVPAYYERLPTIPMTSASKVDRRSLPVPSGPRSLGETEYKAPRTSMERELATRMADILKLPHISISDNFFDDLGGHSLLMARFCTVARRIRGAESLSMREIYEHPTIERLATHLADSDASEKVIVPSIEHHVPSRLQYCTCGALQLATLLALGCGTVALVLEGAEWVHEAKGDQRTLYVRTELLLLAVLWTGALFPIAAKWLLVGRWTPSSIPVWSWRYFRFWLVKLLMRASPMNLYRGTPLYNLYLRLLGARIGRNSVIQSPAPVCTDLFCVGDDTFVRRDTLLPGYYAEGNIIHIGSIRIGSNAYVGSACVIEPDTRMGDRSQLGHSSCLGRGQEIPAGKRFHGTPAIETETTYCPLEGRQCSAFRRWAYTALTSGLQVFVVLPLIVGVSFSFAEAGYEHATMGHGTAPLPWSDIFDPAPSIAATAALIFASVMIFQFASVALVPRIARHLLEEGREYPLFGWHYFVHRVVEVASNSRFLNTVFGDSSFIVHYLRLVGYRLNKVHQTGSNFGLEQRHEEPFLCSVGHRAMVSDGLTAANAEFSSSSFRLRPVHIGERSYLGNRIFFPAASRTGANLLIATKAMVPIDGKLRENTGLLGSPCFEIPRIVDRDRQASPSAGEVDPKLLHKKNKANLTTMALYLMAQWLVGFLLFFLMTAVVLHYPDHIPLVEAAMLPVMLAVHATFWLVTERASLGFGRLQSRTVGLYDDYFLFHERHWKFCAHPFAQALAGTPFKNVISRLLGVRIGKMVFDDGANLFDKTLLTIGDLTNLNAGCILQAHSLEEGLFKSDQVRIGSNCTIASSAFVHYGVSMGDGTMLGPNAFLMKGEQPDPGSIWIGNPARVVNAANAARAETAQPPAPEEAPSAPSLVPHERAA
ncbi:Linear gramicidin synthase subunit D [Hartmannibacter diazotrophicus]|uniref:Linear gramicidin synthase subunit D n=1 Tax=Hartmannibacter diazotrophicus TaxID=1482074 RepID=A0A2C9D9F8_9HYPH|nr:Pls/PosA family non-ribosomal peptide synthetase [Hartmannibacter diazotrophicus]SON56778.1 Linear gramicidin synthase subunit D [Hartmannibacter diazotrophicus]